MWLLRKDATKSKSTRTTYETAKIEKFDKDADITVDNLKFHPIAAHSETYTYNLGQVIGNYMEPLYSNNDYIIRNTQGFQK